MSARMIIASVFLTFFVTVASPVLSQAQGNNENNMIDNWSSAHDRQVIILIQSYLQSKPPSVQHEALKEIVRLEVLLGTVSTDPDNFYLDKVNPDDITLIPGQILDVYLASKGIDMDACRFFEGKRVKYFANDL